MPSWGRALKPHFDGHGTNPKRPHIQLLEFLPIINYEHAW